MKQDILDLKKSIDYITVKKIFGNKENAFSFLLAINSKKYTALEKEKADVVYSEIEKIWDYKKAILLIRNIFKTTAKYKNGKNGDKLIKTLLGEWDKLNFGKVEWPFSQGAFDAFVQSINSESSSRRTKDNKVKTAATRYRRIKEINTVRNDFLEMLIFEKNENIIPTLSHSRGVDFFIDGRSFDQKVAKSPTAEFKKDFGDNWRNEAIKNPAKVAEYLYEFQDEGRFGDKPRLFIVYLDEDVTLSKAKNIISKLDLKKPLNVTFNFKHKDGGVKTYNTFCYVVLLHN